MKLAELLLEYGSFNPFVVLVWSIDLKIRAMDEAAHASVSKIFITSLKSQLNNLHKLVDSASNWNIPEPKLKSEFDATLPGIKRHINSALSSLDSGKVEAAKAHLFAARKLTVKNSHLKFGDIQ